MLKSIVDQGLVGEENEVFGVVEKLASICGVARSRQIRVKATHKTGPPMFESLLRYSVR